MKKIAVALIALSFILTSCSGNARSNVSEKSSMITKTNANYLEYSQAALEEGKGDRVLFFHAAWCGTCVKASESFSENATTDNLTVYKVDFDNSTELRAKYEVTDKHTFVQIDKYENKVSMWRGSNDIADIKSNLVESIKKDTMIDKKSDMMNSKKEQVLELAHKMERDAMNEVNDIYTDLVFVKNIAKEDNLNLTAMSEEEWLYSAKHNVTVVTCKALNTPAYVFDGDMISDTELTTVKSEMKEMMEMMMADGDMMMDKEIMSDSKDEMVEKEVMMKKEGKFVTYSAEEVANTQGTKVLFFHAKWCPACTGAAKNLSASTAPEGLNVFKVDYDTSADLKKKYGIVGQHTFVQIDDNGKMLKRWFGSRNYEDILAQL